MERLSSQRESAEGTRKQRLVKEREGLLSAAHGKAGQWIAAAMLALSAQGCARIAEVAGDTTYHVDFALDPRREDEGGPREGRVTVTAHERLSDDRLPLLRTDDTGEDILVVERLGNRWMEEMTSGRTYLGSDGHRYVTADFPTVGDSTEPIDPGAREIERAWSERMALPFRVMRRREIDVPMRHETQRRVYYLLRSTDAVTEEL